MLGSRAPTAGPPLDEATTAPEPFRSLQIGASATAGAAKKKRRPAGTPGVPARPEPADAPAAAQGAVEAAEAGSRRGGAEAGVRLPGADVPPPRPLHALGDLVGIKKHFRRKHSGHRQWACARCSKAYAVHSTTRLTSRPAAPAATPATAAAYSPVRRIRAEFPREPPRAAAELASFAVASACLCGARVHLLLAHLFQQPAAASSCSRSRLVYLAQSIGSREGHVFALRLRCARQRVESFIEHQDSCNAGRGQAAPEGGNVSTSCGVRGAALFEQDKQEQAPAAVSLSRTASSTSPSSDVIVSPVAWTGAPAMPSPNAAAAFRRFDKAPSSPPSYDHYRGASTHNLELQLMPPFNAGGAAPGTGTCFDAAAPQSPVVSHGQDASMPLQLSISVCSGDRRGELMGAAAARPSGDESTAARAKEEAREQLRQAMAEKSAADEARAQARQQVELAEQELATARRVRHQAQVELSHAHALREHAVRQVNATLLQITCFSCRHKFRSGQPASISSEVACSYVSSVVTEGGDADEPLDVNGATRRRQHANMDIV
ncbi:hypothetical protein GUJ93_ZPchr0009g1199 [Zizania palustris]|uniref:BIRD-IDD transcription factor second C2H2 zinc finger domain-containing protein n=1 Tax=Zizania palustris TaxID=103762 RepID=A0A8J5V7A0_ZIZPA|nr:hypothetical protein GUJ93_ZPchr0009g1199 [Zizania palustris]